ncbi:hypothetical protein FB451DRAFT_1235546, partial [Mycena latifolia]
MFCLANLPQNSGPNTTTFIPGGIFPTRYRSTAYGNSAATGKLGAIVEQVTFNQLVYPANDPNKFLGHSLTSSRASWLRACFRHRLCLKQRESRLQVLSNGDQVWFILAPETEIETEDGIVIPVR